MEGKGSAPAREDYDCDMEVIMEVGAAKKDHLNRIVCNNITLSPGSNEINVKAKSGKLLLEDTSVWNV